MSVIARPQFGHQDHEDRDAATAVLHRASFATVQVRTMNSTYVVVCREFGRVVVCPDGTVITTGPLSVRVTDDMLFVWGEMSRLLLRTSLIQRIDVVEN